MLDNAFTPPMYRDTMSACVNPMPYMDYDMLDCGCVAEYTPMSAIANMGGMGVPPMVGGFCGSPYATNLLGNTKMKPQPNKDTVVIAQKSDRENESALKKALTYAGVFLGALAIVGLFKGKHVRNFFNKIFKGGKGPTPAPTPTPTPTPAPKYRKWWNPFSWGRAKAPKPTPTPTPSPAP